MITVHIAIIYVSIMILIIIIQSSSRNTFLSYYFIHCIYSIILWGGLLFIIINLCAHIWAIYGNNGLTHCINVGILIQHIKYSICLDGFLWFICYKYLFYSI